MDITLVVVRAFGPHAIGDRITTAEEINATLGSEHAGHVVRLTIPSSPAED